MALTHWKWRIVIALVIIALGLFLFCPKAFSQDPVRGEYLAKSWCISCHNIDPGDMTLRSEVVPSFASIAARSETNQSSLRRSCAPSIRECRLGKSRQRKSAMSLPLS